MYKYELALQLKQVFRGRNSFLRVEWKSQKFLHFYAILQTKTKSDTKQFQSKMRLFVLAELLEAIE